MTCGISDDRPGLTTFVRSYLQPNFTRRFLTRTLGLWFDRLISTTRKNWQLSLFSLISTRRDSSHNYLIRNILWTIIHVIIADDASRAPLGLYFSFFPTQDCTTRMRELAFGNLTKHYSLRSGCYTSPSSFSIYSPPSRSFSLASPSPPPPHLPLFLSFSLFDPRAFACASFHESPSRAGKDRSCDRMRQKHPSYRR